MKLAQRLVFGTLILVAAAPAPGQQIFSSSFEDGEVAETCPDSVAMVPMINNAEDTFYQSDGAIDPAGDVDFLAFPAESGNWYLVGTSQDGIPTDTVVTLYSLGQQVARNNDTIPFVSTDSELYYRTTATSPLCVRVEDRSTADGETPEGGAEYLYRALAVPLNFEAFDLYNVDAGNNDSTASPQTSLSYEDELNQQSSVSRRLLHIAGDYDSLSDTDVYELITPTSAVRMQLSFTPGGIDGYGGTTTQGIVDILAADGSTVVGRMDYTKNRRGLSLPAAGDTTYYLKVGAPQSALGANPFYYFKWETVDGQNFQETDNSANNASGGADTAPPIDFGLRVSHFIGGNLSGGSDTDWWSFEAEAGDTISVACASLRNGSGVQDMTARVYFNPAVAPLQQDIESETVDMFWGDVPDATRPPVTTASTGTHFLSISASLFSPTVTDRHYQCGIHVQ